MKNMMIELVRHGACKDCPEFELEVEEYGVECFRDGSNEYINQYDVGCKHERACSYMRGLMQKEAKKCTSQ